MRILLSIPSLAGAAFEDAPKFEVARILREAAERVESQPMAPGDEIFLRDVNGNTVGVLNIEH